MSINSISAVGTASLSSRDYPAKPPPNEKPATQPATKPTPAAPLSGGTEPLSPTVLAALMGEQLTLHGSSFGS